jgi:hypothetical protein
MGLMTELFVAAPERAVTYRADSSADFERVQLGGVTSLEFETLWAILDGEAWNVDKHRLREVASTEAEWVFEFPVAYVEKLKSLSEAAKESAASSWAETDELAGSSAGDLAEVIDRLIALSQAAAKAGRGLFVWFSL